MKNPSLPQCLWGFDLLSSWLAREGGSTYDYFTHKKIFIYPLCSVVDPDPDPENLYSGSGCDL